MAPRFFSSPLKFRAWLQKNHAVKTELVVGFYKTATGKPSMVWSESVDQALCFGWIDGIRRSIDADSYSIRFTPRKAKSIWSAVNSAKVTSLIAEGLMQPAGLTEVEAAKADGRLKNAYDPPSRMSVPADLLARLSKNKKAAAFFETLNKTNKYAITWRLQTAKKPETREKRMKLIMAMLIKGEKFH